MKKIIITVTMVSFAFITKVTANHEPFLKEKKSVLLKSSVEAGSRTPKQVVKLNISQLFLTNLALQYEYGFHKNFSAALGVSYLVPRKMPTQVYDEPSSADGFISPKFGGFSITPEIRFYPGKKETRQAPHGFYLAPYFRYTRYTVSADYNEVVSPTVTNKYKGTATYSGNSFGLMIGSQWIIGKHFSIDWWIIGGGYGKAKLKLEAVALNENLNYTDLEQENLKNDLKNNIGELGRYGDGNVTLESTPNSASATVKGLSNISLRGLVVFGFNLGFVF